ncbi:MAG: restriction endonuclease subunit S [Candidatus Gracilibacteria bacterium]|nr:restriction endonuclease subunit S [Candidatus Gracilibacteria bacterium]
MSDWQKVKIGDFLKRIKRSVVLEDDKEYKLVTIQLHHKGLKLREYKKGGEIKSNMHEVKAGDFILSGIDARNGAFGIVGDELNGAIVTNDFWYFELNEELIDKHFFLELTSTKWFDEICRLGSDGTTQRIRLQKSKFFDQEIYLPSVEKQKEVSKKFISIKQKKEQLKKECSSQQSHLTLLRQQILQDAISGKLTADWRADNPDTEPASKLLEQIKAEKENLIAEKKIKKEKSLPSISENEVPFALPEGWEWCRLGEITTYGTSKKIEPKNISDDVWVLDLEDIEKESSRIINYEIYKNRKSNSTKSIFKKGDILYSKLRPYLDKVVVAPKDGICTTEILPLPVFGDMDSGFFMYAMKRRDFLRYADQKVKGMKMPRLGTEDGKRALFPLPPRAEQRAIVAKVERLMGYVSQLEEKIAQNANNAETLMQAFLGEVFRK